MVADLLRDWRPAEPADAADTRATPSARQLRNFADSADMILRLCGLPQYPQPSANPQTRAQPSDPQHPQHPQDTAPGIAFQRARLIAAAQREGIPRGVIEFLDDADLEGVELLADAGLSAYARMIEADADRMQGRVPRGWTQAVRCRRCGPVVLWPGAPLDVLGCPWCVPRSRGVTIPRPAITCMTCAHWRPAADNPGVCIGDCAQGEERRNPHQQHTCAAWTPEASS